MKKLTEDEKYAIVREMLEKEPMEAVGQIALIKLAELAVSTNAEDVTLRCESTFDGKRYDCKMVVTAKKLKTLTP